jgi:hypothetical protein
LKDKWRLLQTKKGEEIKVPHHSCWKSWPRQSSKDYESSRFEKGRYTRGAVSIWTATRVGSLCYWRNVWDVCSSRLIYSILKMLLFIGMERFLLWCNS